MGKHNERHWTEVRDESVKDYLTRRLNTPLVQPHPKAKNHGRYLEAIERSGVVVCTGPAGTGKTYMACGKAVEHLRAGKVQRIVLTRPLKECGQEMGFLPGDLYQKVVDMMMPLIENLEEFTSQAEVERMRADGRLVIIPLEKMRGRTMKDAFVILDEAQNATFTQLKMFLTRYGNGKMVVCGDYTQSDLPYKGMNSLRELIERFKSMATWHPEVEHVVFTQDDIVRSGLVRWFVEATEGAFVPTEQRRDDGHKMVPCPGCDKDVWYEGWVESADDTLVACPSCEKLIELCDQAGRFDPAIIKKPHRDDKFVIGFEACPAKAS